MLKETLYRHVPNLFQVARQVAILEKDGNVREVNGIVWTLSMTFCIPSATADFSDFLAALREIRKETLMDDGWIDYRKRYQ